MDEKRFVSEDDCCGYYTEIIDNEKELNLSLYNPKKNLTIEELVGLMNDLNDENIELHIQNDFLKDENQHMRNLVNENKQLKQKVDFYKYFQKDARELEKENEQLKLENELLERDLHYCAKQFKEDVKNILLDLKGGLND